MRIRVCIPCLYVHVHVYILNDYARVCKDTCIRSSIYVYVYMSMHMHMYIHVYVCIDVVIHVYRHAYICMITHITL